MSAEKSGYNLVVSCTQDPSIVFPCKSKRRPGVKLAGKIDVTTDQSQTARDFEPGDLLEITPGELTLPDDPELAAKIIAILGVKGSVIFTGRTTGKTISYSNAWFASYTPNTVNLDLNLPTATVLIDSSGGSTGVPEVK